MRGKVVVGCHWRLPETDALDQLGHLRIMTLHGPGVYMEALDKNTDRSQKPRKDRTLKVVTLLLQLLQEKDDSSLQDFEVLIQVRC